MYERLGFAEAVNDDVFRDLVIARVIEPSSKLDTIRILDELGLASPSNTGIHRCLDRVADSGYRDRLSAACVQFRGMEQLTLVLYPFVTREGGNGGHRGCWRRYGRWRRCGRWWVRARVRGCRRGGPAAPKGVT